MILIKFQRLLILLIFCVFLQFHIISLFLNGNDQEFQKFSKFRRFNNTNNITEILSREFVNLWKRTRSSAQLRLDQLNILSQTDFKQNFDIKTIYIAGVKVDHWLRNYYIYDLPSDSILPCNPHLDNWTWKKYFFYPNYQNHQNPIGLGQCRILHDFKGQGQIHGISLNNSNFIWDLHNRTKIHAQLHYGQKIGRQINTNISLPKDLFNIFITFESPFYTKNWRLNRDRDLLISYWKNAHIWNPYFRWKYYDTNVKFRNQSVDFYEGKNKLAAIFMSNCQSLNNRMGFIQKLQKFMQIDIFGLCGNKTCPIDDPKCFQMLKNDYFFYLAFENSNCRDYITEKFLHGLKYGSIPVVLGAHPDDYKALGPEGSYILVEDFPSPKELADFLINLSENRDFYNEYFKWRDTGQFLGVIENTEPQLKEIGQKLICNICTLLHYAQYIPPPKSRKSINISRRMSCLKKNKIFWDDNF